MISRHIWVNYVDLVRLKKKMCNLSMESFQSAQAIQNQWGKVIVKVVILLMKSVNWIYPFRSWLF